MYSAWELDEYSRPHSPRVAAHILENNKTANLGNNKEEVIADPVLMALNTDAPPGGLLSTLKETPKSAIRKRRIRMI